MYQARFALLKLLDLPENATVLIEKDDDLEFSDDGGQRSLSSLKHKAESEVLRDLDADFWKSVRVWLSAYFKCKKIDSSLNFFLFTTSEIADSSSLKLFKAFEEKDISEKLEFVELALSRSEAVLIAELRLEFALLDENEIEDFLSRIAIFDCSPRITDVPRLVMDQHMRTIRRENRLPLFERLEGWWNDLMIKLLAKHRIEAIAGFEVSDKLAALAEEYKSDNLPITFRGRNPEEGIDVETDGRIFVQQLRFIGVSAARIQSAIIDYYRAIEHRSSWARENLLVLGEMEEYETRLEEEWQRFKNVLFEKLNEDSDEQLLMEASQELYRWAELETSGFRIRERVTEGYVVRGGFHILANYRPRPRVFWHPNFLKRLQELLESNQ